MKRSPPASDHAGHESPRGQKGRWQSACHQCATRSRCLLGAASDADLQGLEPHIRTAQLEDGERLLEQGDMPDMLRIVKSGHVVALHTAPCGNELPVCVSGRGAPVGLLTLFDLPVGFTAQAMGPVLTCDIDRHLLRGHPWWTARLMPQAVAMANEYLRRTADWAAATHHPNATAKLTGCLLLMQREAGDAWFRMPTGKIWSALLGLSRETVSKSVGILKKGLFIERGPNHMIRIDTGRACDFIASAREVARKAP